MHEAWTRQNERVANTRRAKCFMFLWMQWSSYRLYARLRDLLTYPVIAMSATNGCLLFGWSTATVRTISACLCLVNVLLFSLLVEFSPGRQMEKHLVAAKKYGDLIRELDLCLALPATDRSDPASVVISKMDVELGNIAEFEPDVPRIIARSFEAKYGEIESELFEEEIVDVVKRDLRANSVVRAVLET